MLFREDLHDTSYEINAFEFSLMYGESSVKFQLIYFQVEQREFGYVEFLNQYKISRKYVST